MAANQQVKKMMQGAFVLFVASLIAKILSAVYRIPFENLVGNTGFYVYQQIYPFYGLGMTFALTGFPVFISKLSAEQSTEQDRIQLLQQIFVILSVFAVGIFAVLQIFAEYLAVAMGDQQLAPLIRSVSWMFFLMPMLAVGRGYYQSQLNMVPTAISQVSEQIVRVTVILVVAVLTVRYNWSLYKMGCYALASATVAAIAASVVFAPFYLKRFFKKNKDTTKFSYVNLSQRLFTEGIILCLFASILLLFQLVDSFTIKKTLVVLGQSDLTAKITKGIYDRAQPLVQLGLVISLSLATSLFPTLTQAYQQHKIKQFHKTARLGIKISLILSAATTVGLISLMPQINQLLFKTSELNLTLSLYCLSIIFVTLINSYNAILQSINRYQITVSGLILALGVKISCNTWFMHLFGIQGASLATVLALMLGLGLILLLLPRQVKGYLKDPKLFWQLSIGLVLMLGVVKLSVLITSGWISSLDARMQAGILTLVGSVCGAVIFIWYLLQFKILTIREWLTLPGGKKILKLVQRKKG